MDSLFLNEEALRYIYIIVGLEQLNQSDHLDAEKWVRLRDWFLENGGELSDAYKLFNFRDTGRGVMARRKVYKGERFVQGNGNS